MDGTNCRSPIGVGMMDGPAIKQTWESNRAVRMENVGATDVVNPWLSSGRNSFRTLGEIVASAVEPGMTDREKAFLSRISFQDGEFRAGRKRWRGVTPFQVGARKHDVLGFGRWFFIQSKCERADRRSSN